jgi:hypothetical protein
MKEGCFSIVGGGKVGGSKNRSAIGQGKAIEWPATLSFHQMDSIHIYLIHIGAFFSVHLYANKILVLATVLIC